MESNLTLLCGCWKSQEIHDRSAHINTSPCRFDSVQSMLWSPFEMFYDRCVGDLWAQLCRFSDLRRTHCLYQWCCASRLPGDVRVLRTGCVIRTTHSSTQPYPIPAYWNTWTPCNGPTVVDRHRRYLLSTQYAFFITYHPRSTYVPVLIYIPVSTPNIIILFFPLWIAHIVLFSSRPLTSPRIRLMRRLPRSSNTGRVHNMIYGHDWKCSDCRPFSC